MEYKPSDTHRDTGAQSALESRLPAMLSRLADEAPASVGLADRVERQLTTNASATPQAARWQWGGVFGAPVWRQRVVSAVGLVVVLTLIAGFAVVLRSHQSVGRQPSGTIARQSSACGSHGTLIDNTCHLHGAKVSITVTNSYADTVRASVELRITLANAQTFSGSSSRERTVLTVSTGGITLAYAPGRSERARNGFGTGMNATGSTNEVDIFPALPSNLNGAQHRLTLHIPQLLVLINHVPSALGDRGAVAVIDGPWTLPFTVTPQQSHTITFDVAPVTHQGVTVQPIQLNVAPDVSSFDGLRGGEQLIIQISGLPASMELSDLIGFGAVIQFANGSSGTANTNSGAQLTFEGQQPALVAVAGSDAFASDGSQEVGPTGAVTLEVSFTGPALPTLTGTQPLVINQIGLNNGLLPVIVGPWSFQLPLK